MSTEHHDSAVRAPGGRPRLLIADDDEVVLTTLDAQLRAEFDVVGVAHDGDQAIELARVSKPEVAIVDVQMPAGGGLRATRGIREVSPATALVILSVDESDASVVDFLNAGAITYLRKGTTAAEIAARLHESIAAHHAITA